eukprot:g3714.t1
MYSLYNEIKRATDPAGGWKALPKSPHTLTKWLGLPRGTHIHPTPDNLGTLSRKLGLGIHVKDQFDPVRDNSYGQGYAHRVYLKHENGAYKLTTNPLVPKYWSDKRYQPSEEWSATNPCTKLAVCSKRPELVDKCHVLDIWTPEEEVEMHVPSGEAYRKVMLDDGYWMLDNKVKGDPEKRFNELVSAWTQVCRHTDRIKPFGHCGDVAKTITRLFWLHQRTISFEPLLHDDEVDEAAWLPPAGGLITCIKGYEGKLVSYDKNAFYASLMADPRLHLPVGQPVPKCIDALGEALGVGLYKVRMVAPPELDGQCRPVMLRPGNVYTHWDIKAARLYNYDIELIMDQGPNYLHYPVRATASSMFKAYIELCNSIEAHVGSEGRKFIKVLRNRLWGTLSTLKTTKYTGKSGSFEGGAACVYPRADGTPMFVHRKGPKYPHGRMAPFLTAKGRYEMASVLKPVWPHVKRIHTDGAMVEACVDVCGILKVRPGMGNWKVEHDKSGHIRIENVNRCPKIRVSHTAMLTDEQKKAKKALHHALLEFYYFHQYDEFDDRETMFPALDRWPEYSPALEVQDLLFLRHMQVRPEWASRHKDRNLVLTLSRGGCGWDDRTSDIKEQLGQIHKSQKACFVAYMLPRANQIAGVALLNPAYQLLRGNYVHVGGTHIMREDMTPQELRVLWVWEQLVFTGPKHYKRLREMCLTIMPGDTEPLAKGCTCKADDEEPCDDCCARYEYKNERVQCKCGKVMLRSSLYRHHKQCRHAPRRRKPKVVDETTVECWCGAKVSKTNFARHLKTQKHEKALENR